MNNMSQRIATLRKERYISLEKLEERLSATRQTISKWETGQSIPSAEDLKEMCSFYGCDAGYIFGEYDEKRREATDIKRETGLSEKAINVLRKLQADKNVDNEIIDFLNLIIESAEFRHHMWNLSKSSMEYIKGYIEKKVELENPSAKNKMFNSPSIIIDIESGKAIKKLKSCSKLTPSSEDNSDLMYDEYDEKAYHLSKTLERLIMFISKNAGAFKQLEEIRNKNVSDIKKRNIKSNREFYKFLKEPTRLTRKSPVNNDETS